MILVCVCSVTMKTCRNRLVVLVLVKHTLQSHHSLPQPEVTPTNACCVHPKYTFLRIGASFKSSLTRHDVPYVNDASVGSQINNRAGCDKGRGCLVIAKSLPQCVRRFSVRSNQDILPSSSLCSSYNHYWLRRWWRRDAKLETSER